MLDATDFRFMVDEATNLLVKRNNTRDEEKDSIKKAEVYALLAIAEALKMVAYK